MSSAQDSIAAALVAAGLANTIRTLDSSARTAALAAEQLGVDVGAIANSLVFNADGEPLLVMTSGAHRVDTAMLAATLGMTKIKRADPDFVRAATGQTIGGVAPTGHPAPLRTIVDMSLADFPLLWAAAGHPNSVFSLTFHELVALTSGAVMNVCDDT